MKKKNSASLGTEIQDKRSEIHKRGNNYYLCKVTSVWDKKLKRPGKITGEYLG